MQETGVTRDDVVWCFRNILRREIDHEDVGHFVSTERDFRSLVDTLLRSAEFTSRLGPVDGTVVKADGFLYDVQPRTQDRVRRVLDRMLPHEAEGFRKIRVGSETDGGYVMLDDFAGIQAAYSLGINDDVTWDRHIAELGIDVYQYDHTIDALPEPHPRFHWFKTGIAATTHGTFDTLPNLMRANGHGSATDLLLKCDIEGHEWEMLAAMTVEELGRFRQIVLETHGWQLLADSAFAPSIEAAVANLCAGHRLVHVHANNHAAYAIVGGIPLPAVLEVTFVRAKGKRMRPSNETFPTALDRSCKPGAPDYALGQFRF